MRIIECVSLALAATFAFGVQAADLGTHPTITIVGDPALTASGPSWVSSAIPQGTGFSSALIQMSYFFEIAGPGGFVPVPVIVDYALSGSGTGRGVALSSIQVFTTGSSGPKRSVSASGGHSYDVDESMSFTINTNAAYHVILIASAGTSLVDDAAAAYSDPYIHVEDDWLSTHPGYVVNVTPGVINQVASAVPEPSTLVLMLSGIAAVAGLGRRRRQAARVMRPLQPAISMAE